MIVTPSDVIAVIVIAALLFCAVRYWFVLQKKGGCGGCSGCSGCDSVGKCCKNDSGEVGRENENAR